ncbi:winged helix-turn-helix transcriptional regulator [Candidatus Micrarchaeota archaeon]|nr:winged helix-turn-helix transcriptional regulator [Candidatus Micrarchaeota archaeon]
MKCKCHAFFETLATKLKMDIVEALEEGPLSVNEITKRVGVERSTVSHALLSLAECSFVEAKENGRQRVYSLNKETMAPILRRVEKHVKKYCRRCKK